MHLIRRNAKQGHAIPSMASAPSGPFPHEIFAQTRVVIDDNDPDYLYPPSATAQNGYALPRVFRCTYCDDLVPEYDLDYHVCPDDDEDEEEDDDG